MPETAFQHTKNFFATAFRSLKYRDFRLFWFGQCISLTGTWMQRTAQTWLVYTVTNSPLLVGLTGVAQFLPLLLFSLFAGVVADRFPKKRLIILTQVLFAAQAAAMTILTFTGQIQYWHILLLSFLFGLTQTFDLPVRQAFFADLTGEKDLTNAISLNSTIVNLARILGPAAAGICMAQFGAGFCFLLNFISYFPVIAGLILIHANGASEHRSNSNLLPEIADGIRCIRVNQTLVLNVLAMAAVCTFAMNTDVIIPVFAGAVLGLGVNGYSALLSAAGMGAFAAAVLMAYLSKSGVRKNLLLISGAATGLLQAATVLTHSYFLCLALVFSIGFFNLMFINTANFIFQMESPAEYRGRIMGVYSLLNLGSTPVGNFFAGFVMENFGGGSGFLFCGTFTFLFLMLILLFKHAEAVRWMRRAR